MAKGKSGAKSLPPLLDTGEVLRDRFLVGSKLGGGGFGQIFRALDKERDDDVAIKIEPANADKRRMKLEHTVLTLLRGKPHIPKIRGSGQVRGCSFIVMTLLGQNLSELRRHERSRKLSVSTTFRVAVEMAAGLRLMHEIGYLHRDVKPSNCCIGLRGEERHKIYILDFGMTRKFRNADGTVRKAREYVGFRGTVRYASPTVHARREPGPTDDFVSLLYSLIELVKGTLPWTQLNEAKEVEERKLNITPEDLCKNLPAGVLRFAQYVLGLKYDETPHYDLINTHFMSCWPNGVTATTPYDWEVGHDRAEKLALTKPEDNVKIAEPQPTVPDELKAAPEGGEALPLKPKDEFKRCDGVGSPKESPPPPPLAGPSPSGGSSPGGGQFDSMTARE